MPQVDFYILHTQMKNVKERFACRLVDTIWHQGYRVYIHVPSLESAHQFDNLLWTFKQDSFIPHDIYPDVPHSLAAVRIGYGTDTCPETDVLVNLTEIIPAFYTGCQRVVEIIENNDMALEKGRERFRVYRDQGNSLKYHDINV